jgi:hypothetical protein
MKIIIIILILIPLVNLFSQQNIDASFNGSVYPEQYTSPATTDWTDALTNAILDARDLGKAVILSRETYPVTSKINIDLQNSSLTLLSNVNSEIISTVIVEINDIETPEAAIFIQNGKTVTISGVSFTFTNAGSVNYLNGLLIIDCDRVFLNQVKCAEAPFGGGRIKQVNYLSARDCNFSHNLYAGLIVENVPGGIISGGEYSYNGTTFPVNGYGINLAHRSGTRIDNEGFLIEGAKAFYNLRKGIDLHGGIKCKIIANHVKGFGNSGIYATNEPGSDPDAHWISDTSWYKYVNDITIAFNTIENDSAWFITHSLNPSQGNDGCPVFIGSYDDSTLSAGNFYVYGNMIRHCNTPYARAHIFVFAALGAPMDVISIKDNTINDARVSNYWSDGVIAIIGNVPPKLVEITGNKIYGVGDTAISVNIGDMVKVNFNTISGIFNYPDPEIDYNSPQQSIGNTYNNKPLPDMVSKDNGSLEYYITTSGTSQYLDFIKVNPLAYSGGMTNYDITIIASSYGYNATYNFKAYAGNNGSGEIITDVSFPSQYGLLGDPSLYTPSASWVYTGGNEILRINFPIAYTGYKVNIQISGWRLSPKGAL